MKAIIIEDFGGTDQLKMADVDTPVPANDEVLIHISYAGVNPVDWKICEGWFKDHFPHQFPLVLGWDSAGTIAQVGKKVKNFKVGDEVYAYCRKPQWKWGTYAEYITIAEENVALKPQNITFAQAAALPIAGLTSWQALFEEAKVKEGESVLIHAGAGGVGSLAIQLAKMAGAKVYTTASQINHDYVKQLGADIAIDYKKDNFVSHIKLNEPKGVDVVFDTVGGNTLKESMKVIKEGGRLVSIVDNLDPSDRNENLFQFSYVFVKPNGEQLRELTSLIETGKIIAPQIEEMQLSDADFAQDKIKKHHTRGKIVLKVP